MLIALFDVLVKSQEANDPHPGRRHLLLTKFGETTRIESRLNALKLEN
jgi:hypothetical protein